MEDHDETLSKFTSITGADADTAKFYLESAVWKIEEALARFFERSDDNAEDVIMISDEESNKKLEDIPKKDKNKAASSGSGGSRIATVSSLKKETSDDEEEGQAFYAGGSTHSGQQVLGPSKGKKKDFVAEMFKAVHEHGVEIVDAEPSGSQKSNFSGTGYKLGQTENDSEVVEAGGSKKSLKKVDIVLKLWRDGFSLNNGPLRSYNDPENQKFLNSVRKGEIPEELIRDFKHSEVHLNMEDHRMEEFVQTKQKVKPFTGQGHTLGSPAPQTVSLESCDGKASSSLAENEEKAKKDLNLKSDEPTTKIQIRLADGSRLLATFNLNHTINQIRQYIIACRPEYQNASFVLMSTFPNRELTALDDTIENAKIANSSLVQRLK